MYVYKESERWVEKGHTHVLYTVGFYDPDGKWHPESDHDNQEEAAKRVAYLNGSESHLKMIQKIGEIKEELKKLKGSHKSQ